MRYLYDAYFLLRASKNVIFTARRYANAVHAVIVCLSVRPSVCHMPVLYQNTQDHGNNAIL